MSDRLEIGRRNVTWGWCVMVLGALSGSVIGLWSFDGPAPPPDGFHAYTDLPRRMVRLAHVALFMLPVINILIGRELDQLRLNERWKQIASWSAIVGMIGIPSILIVAATVSIQLKYLEAVPVSGLTIAIMLVAWGRCRR